MEAYIVHKKIRLHARPEEVWQALTDPDLTKEYFFKCRVKSLWKKGSMIRFVRKFLLFFKFELKGRIIDIVPGKLLKYELKNSGKESSSSIVTDKLTFADGITTLEITDNVGKGEGAEKRYRRSVKGWNKVLAGLKKLVEG